MDAPESVAEPNEQCEQPNTNSLHDDMSIDGDINNLSVDLMGNVSPIDLSIRRRNDERLSPRPPLIRRPQDVMNANKSVLPKGIVDEMDLLAWTPVPREVSEFWRGASNMGVYSNPKNRQV